MQKRSGAGRFRRSLVIMAVLSALLAQGVPRVSAADDINSLQQQLNDLSQKKSQATNELQRLNVEAEEAQTQLNLVDQEYNDAKGQLDAISSQVVSATNELKKIQADLQEAEKKYQVRKQVLSTRIRAISEEGRVNYIGVLLGSSSFADFISRFDFLKMVVKQDSQLFNQIKQDKQALEDKRQAADNRRTQLVALQAQAKERESTVAQKRAEHETVSRSLNTRISALKDQLDAYDREAQSVSDRVWQLQQSQNRKRTGAFQPIYPIHGSIIITDPFGPRMHPILHEQRMHYGTDFAADMGQAVYAIEDGTVIVAGWNDAYGNLVVIDHGGGYASWYGHASKLLVSVGQTVKQGQQITQAGATGWATGPHLHLEIHVNGTPVDPMTMLP